MQLLDSEVVRRCAVTAAAAAAVCRSNGPGVVDGDAVTGKSFFLPDDGWPGT